MIKINTKNAKNVTCWWKKTSEQDFCGWKLCGCMKPFALNDISPTQTSGILSDLHYNLWQSLFQWGNSVGKWKKKQHKATYLCSNVFNCINTNTFWRGQGQQGRGHFFPPAIVCVSLAVQRDWNALSISVLVNFAPFISSLSPSTDLKKKKDIIRWVTLKQCVRSSGVESWRWAKVKQHTDSSAPFSCSTLTNIYASAKCWHSLCD